MKNSPAFLLYCPFFLCLVSSCGTQKAPRTGNGAPSAAAAGAGTGNPSDIVEKYWKLTEIGGEAVTPSDKWRREPHMILKAEGGRVNGHGGCNSFFGTYALPEAGRLQFSGIGSTRMACDSMAVEYKFFQSLQAVHRYTLGGDTLALTGSDGAVLARFAVVYLR